MAEERRKSDPAKPLSYRVDQFVAGLLGHFPADPPDNCRARWRLNLNLFFKTAHLAKNPNA